MQEVLDHTEKVASSALFTAASRDFGQARQILESVQVWYILYQLYEWYKQARILIILDISANIIGGGREQLDNYQ